jgi:arylsulfatase A-like enzyme
MPSERLDWLLAQYAGDARWTDATLGEFFALLRARGVWDDALVIVTADHGEEFFEHGEKGHKKNLYAETVHVPLIVKYPGQREARRDTRLVSLVDVMPTVLALAGGDTEQPMQGRSLESEPEPARAIAFDLRSTWFAAGGAREQRWAAVRDPTHKLIWSEGGGAPGRTELYDAAEDPREERDLIDAAADTGASLRARYDALLEASLSIAQQYEAGGEATLDADELEQLRELGYLPR